MSIQPDTSALLTGDQEASLSSRYPAAALTVFAHWLLESVWSEVCLLERSLMTTEATLYFLSRTTSVKGDALKGVLAAGTACVQGFRAGKKAKEAEYEMLAGRLANYWNKLRQNERKLTKAPKFISTDLVIKRDVLEAGILALDVWEFCFRSGHFLMSPTLAMLESIHHAGFQRMQALDPVKVPRSLVRQDEFASVFEAMDDWAGEAWKLLHQIAFSEDDNPAAAPSMLMLWEYALTDRVAAPVGNGAQTVYTVSGCFFLPLSPHYQPVIGHEIAHLFMKGSWVAKDNQDGIENSWIDWVRHEVGDHLTAILSKTRTKPLTNWREQPALDEFLADLLGCAVSGPGFVPAHAAQLSKGLSASIQMTPKNSAEKFPLMRLYQSARFAEDLMRIRQADKYKLPPCLMAVAYLYEVWWKLVSSGAIVEAVKPKWWNVKDALDQRKTLEPVFFQCADHMKNLVLHKTRSKISPAFLKININKDHPLPEGLIGHSPVSGDEATPSEVNVEWSKFIEDSNRHNKFDYSHASELIFRAAWIWNERLLNERADGVDGAVDSAFLKRRQRMSRHYYEMIRYKKELDRRRQPEESDEDSSTQPSTKDATVILHQGPICGFCFNNLVKADPDIENGGPGNRRMLSRFCEFLKKSHSRMASVAPDGPTEHKLLGVFAGLGVADVLTVVKELPISQVGIDIRNMKFETENEQLGFSHPDLETEHLGVYFSPWRVTGRLVWTDAGGRSKKNGLDDFFGIADDATTDRPGQADSAQHELKHMLLCQLNWSLEKFTLGQIVAEVERALASLFTDQSGSDQKTGTGVRFLTFEVIGRNAIIILINNFSSLTVIKDVSEKLESLSYDLKITPFFTARSDCKVFDGNGVPRRISRLINVLPAEKREAMVKAVNGACDTLNCIHSTAKTYMAGSGYNLILHWASDEQVKPNQRPMELKDVFRIWETILDQPSAGRAQTNVVWETEITPTGDQSK